MDKIKYLPHPCSHSEKCKWNKKGYKVVDIRFAPSESEQKSKDKKS